MKKYENSDVFQIFLETCSAGRASQKFSRIPGNSGNFRLQSEDGNFCLSAHQADSKIMVSSDCESPDTLWTGNSPLKHSASGLCLDGGAAGGSPLLYPCSSDNVNQRITHTSEKWLRFKQSGNCVDFRPSSIPLVARQCAVTADTFEFIDSFVPFETKAYQKALDNYF